MRVIGILVVGVGRAGTRQGQAAVLAQLGYALGAAGHDVQADEVTALRVRPVGDVAAGGQLLGKGGLDGVKAGHQAAAMLGHVGQDTGLVLEKTDMAQLVHLVVADDHRREALAHVLHRVLAAGDGGDARAREGDLARGGEHKDTVLIAVLLGLVQQNRRLDDLIGQVVDDVRLIPEDLEIGGGGLERGKAADRLVAVGVAVGVGVLRHAPDSLDGVILGDELFNHVHVRAVGAHGHGDQLKAHLLGDAKVAVIAGHGAEELAVLDLAPGLRGILETEHHADGDQVIHQLQAGVAAHENLAGLHAEHIGKQCAGFGQTLQLTVVAGVKAVVGDVVVHLEQVHGQIHLVRAGLAAGHVQLQVHALKLLVLGLQRGLFSGEFVVIHCKVISHKYDPPK